MWAFMDSPCSLLTKFAINGHWFDIYFTIILPVNKTNMHFGGHQFYHLASSHRAKFTLEPNYSDFKCFYFLAIATRFKYNTWVMYYISESGSDSEWMKTTIHYSSAQNQPICIPSTCDVYLINSKSKFNDVLHHNNYLKNHLIINHQSSNAYYLLHPINDATSSWALALLVLLISSW